MTRCHCHVPVGVDDTLRQAEMICKTGWECKQATEPSEAQYVREFLSGLKPKISTPRGPLHAVLDLAPHEWISNLRQHSLSTSTDWAILIEANELWMLLLGSSASQKRLSRTVPNSCAWCSTMQAGSTLPKVKPRCPQQLNLRLTVHRRTPACIQHGRPTAVRSSVLSAKPSFEFTFRL